VCELIRERFPKVHRTEGTTIYSVPSNPLQKMTFLTLASLAHISVLISQTTFTKLHPNTLLYPATSTSKPPPQWQRISFPTPTRSNSKPPITSTHHHRTLYPHHVSSGLDHRTGYISILLETSIIALEAAAISILCRLIWDKCHEQEGPKRQIRCETYIEDRLAWLKKAASSVFPPGSGGLGWSDEEEINDGASETRRRLTCRRW